MKAPAFLSSFILLAYLPTALEVPATFDLLVGGADSFEALVIVRNLLTNNCLIFPVFPFSSPSVFNLPLSRPTLGFHVLYCLFLVS